MRMRMRMSMRRMRRRSCTFPGHYYNNCTRGRLFGRPHADASSGASVSSGDRKASLSTTTSTTSTSFIIIASPFP